jgi:hypothetical protein
LSLAVVRDLRVARAPVTAEDLAALQTDVLAGFVLARVRDSAGGSVAAVPERRLRAYTLVLTRDMQAPSRRPSPGTLNNQPCRA